MKRFLLSAFAAAFLAAPIALRAQSDGPALFRNVTPITIDANSLVVEVQKRAPTDYPHMGHRTPVTFEQAVNLWANSHFELTGAGENTLRVTVREADLVEKLLPVKKGIAGWFRKDQSAEYTATLDLSVALIDANGRQQGSAEAKSLHSSTVPEGTTDAEKQALWLEMMKKMFENIDRELQPRIRQTIASRAG
ncbi:MAG: LPS assembly lipoprotein LptE [Rhodospirillaceae bacterium]